MSLEQTEPGGDTQMMKMRSHVSLRKPLKLLHDTSFICLLYTLYTKHVYINQPDKSWYLSLFLFIKTIIIIYIYIKLASFKLALYCLKKLTLASRIFLFSFYLLYSLRKAKRRLTRACSSMFSFYYIIKQNVLRVVLTDLCIIALLIASIVSRFG